MKLTRLTSLALAASLALPALAQAQTNFYFVGPKTSSTTPNGVADGPYLASLNSNRSSPFDIFCIDYDDVAQSTWVGRVLTFQQAVTAPNYVPVSRVLGNVYNGTSYVTPPGNEATYLRDLKAAAYLSTQFSSNPQSNWADIHGALWSLFSQNPIVDYGNYATFRSAAYTYVDNAANANAFNDYSLIIDNNAYNANYTGAFQQAFITNDSNVGALAVVPEPSTYLLLAAGLVAIGFARRRRNTTV